MSIIYDALKKVEASIHRDSLVIKPDKKERKSKFKNYLPRTKLVRGLLYILVICLGFFIANIFFGVISKPSIMVKSKPPVTQKEALPPLPSLIPKEETLLDTSLPVSTERRAAPLLVLNGVFFSENEGYALINNRIVKKGDVIDGAVVMQINLDGVECKFEDSIIKLSSGSR